MIFVKATTARIPALLLAAVLGLTQLPSAQSPSPATPAAPAQGAPSPAAQAQGAPSPGQAAPAPGAPGQDQPQVPPTFRGAIDFVSVDVIVTDGDKPVLDLAQSDFEITEDGKPQTIEQFRLIKVDGNPRPGAPPPRQLRGREDEETEAARED